MTLHLALVVAVPVFLALGAWQLTRALHGNLLSWAYTFEWPFFACYATWMWWRLVHEETAPPAGAHPEPGRGVGATPTEMSPDESGMLVPGGTTAAAAPGGTTAAAAPGGTTAGAAGRPGSMPLPRSDFDPYDDETAPELAAYNRYLAGLHAEHPKG